MVYTLLNSKNVNAFRGMHIENSVLKRMLLNIFYEGKLQLFELIIKYY